MRRREWEGEAEGREEEEEEKEEEEGGREREGGEGKRGPFRKWAVLHNGWKLDSGAN